MAHLLFGNESIIRVQKDSVFDDNGALVSETSHVVSVPGKSITSYGPPDDWGLDDILISFISDDGAWASHSTAPPTWVECEDDPVLAQLFARHYGCPVGRPDGWQISDHLTSSSESTDDAHPPDDSQPVADPPSEVTS